jgi:glycosyltransferase involved in cell wall biosynthesis
VSARTPRVAVIVPCYNSAGFVAEALDSIAAQSYSSLEIVVVDDGSTDPLEEALAPYRGRVRLVRRDNGGPAAARNTGIDATDTELIAFLDPDDRWHPEKIRRQVAYLDAHPSCGLVATYRRAIDAQGHPLDRADSWRRTWTPTDEPLVTLVTDCSIMSSQVLVRRSTLAGDRFLPEATPVEDWDLWLRLAARTEIGCVAECLTDYRKHATNLSADRTRLAAAVVAMLDRASPWLPEGRARWAAGETRRALAGRA